MSLKFHREDLATRDLAARVHETALRILAEVGLEILSEPVLDRLRAAGFRTRGSRVLFEPAVVEDYVAEMRQRLSSQQASDVDDETHLALYISSYPHHLHDLETDQIVPYTAESLAQMTRLVDTLADEGVYGAVPGYPFDVPPPLQPVIQYRIAAENARNGAYPVDPTSSLTAPYIFEMAEVMGHPIRSLPVYLPSPLRLGGESLEIVLQNVHRLEHIRVSSMPAAGATAPIAPIAAFALAAAELMGGLVALRALTGLPVTFYVEIFPFDLRQLAMVFGSPENFLFQLAGHDLNRFYGHPSRRGAGNMHVMAKLPGPQSAAEKAAIMTAGALLGARDFSGAGALSLDEVFSPEQLLIDCEIRDWVERLVRGLDTTPPDPDLLSEVQMGLTRGFIDQDTTLSNYRRLYWHPRRFERDFLAAWQRAGSPTFRDRIRAEIQERLARHTFQLDEPRRRELERICQAAQRLVSSLG
ncbi:MAG TPA: hypothetical protein G4O02_00095 [Caldilineae bacterium]|nr:hypothetical protein [Caldilineae bacterium]